MQTKKNNYDKAVFRIRIRTVPHVLPSPDPGQKGKETISFLLFRLQESGLGTQDILSEKPWKLKKKKYAGIGFTSEEKATYVFLC